MSEKIEIMNQTALTALTDSDRLFVESGGTLRPVTLENLAKAVRGTMQVGGRNLLLNSGERIDNSNYPIKSYYLSESLKEGEPIVITLWGELAEGKRDFVIHNSGDMCAIGGLVKVAEGVYQLKATWKEHNANNHIRIFPYPNSIKGNSVIEKIKLERGNIATDWTPAPEDLESAKSGG